MWRIIGRLRYLLRQRQFEADLADEMAFHREMAERDLVAGGVAPGDASHAARRAFGSSALARDRAREVWIAPALQDLGGDIAVAVRSLNNDRGFTLAATLTLALGIGAAGALFTIFNGMFLKGLPVDRPDRIVTVGARDRQGRPLQFAPPQFDDWRAAATGSFRALGAYTGAAAVLDDRGQPPERVPSSYLSASAFTVLGERPLLGRTFIDVEDRPGAPPVIIIGEGVWRERYGGDPTIVGRSIAVNGTRATVIGVMPARFRFPLIDKAWLPLGAAPQNRERRRDARTLSVVARLADSATIAQARAELDTIAARLGREYPETDGGQRAAVEPYTHGFSGFDNPWSDSLLAATFLLLIGCTNVANLLFARGAGRARDLAIRTALGATRWRLMRQLVVESAIVAAAAACAGAALTWGGVRIWAVSLPVTNWPYWYRWEIDGRVLGFLAVISVVSALLAGLAPALFLSRAGTAALIKEGARSAAGGPRSRRWTSALLVGELALTLVLLACAGLMVRTTINLLRVDGIVDTSHVLMANVQMTPSRYETSEERSRFVQILAERLDNTPPIHFAAVASAMPFLTAPLRALAIEAQPEAGGPPRVVSYVAIGEEYFDALDVHLVSGRRFAPADGTPSHLAAIVNQQFVRMFFALQDPLGHRIRLTDPNAGDVAARWITIVGVSPTVRQHYAQDLDPVVYVPYRQDPTPVPVVLVRTSGDPNVAAAPIREVLHDLDSGLVLFNVTALDQFLATTGFASRVFLTFFSGLAVFALLLSAIGLYAATRHAVIERRHEIGVRVALGARASQVVWLFAHRTLAVVAVGGLFGLAGAFAGTRLLRGFLVETSPSDPLTLGAVTLLLALVALVATVVSARRALDVDPAVALRAD